MQEIIEQSAVSPEDLEVLNCYLQTTDLTMTAKELGITEIQAAQILKKKEVKKVVDTVFLEKGYLNRFRIQDILGTVIAAKMEEAEESGMYTNKDLIDILSLMHKIQVDERKLAIDAEKAATPTNQNNIQVNEYGANYGDLMHRILEGKTKD